jgi:GDP/UDP-N,N'-diacetylbacillosamine 2-epimerase (hydrolysing)
MNKKNICVVTGSRAEYGLFFPIMKKIQTSNYLELKIVATTMHFSEEFGNTYKQINEDGFLINEKIENLISSDSKSAVAKSTGLAIILLSDAFFRIKPDVVLLLGDRFETHAAATAAILMNIPVAHIHGGEITEGAVDEKLRHSITKMSNLHFTSTENYKNRVIQMGEDPESVFLVGAPGLDNIFNMTLLSKHELENELNWKINQPTALFTYHPETLSSKVIKEEIKKILLEIKNSTINVLFTYANSDNGGRIINNEIENFALLDKTKYLVVKNLGQLNYLSAIKNLDVLIGNTSSGIIEAASFYKPVVNIGNRQLGRLQNKNVINCNIGNIELSISKSISNSFLQICHDVKNIYGDGDSAEKIVKVLSKTSLSVNKKFIDI